MKALLSIIIICLSLPSFARLRNHLTPRLMGSAGAGSASILMTDALFLNPASLAFFDKRAFTYQYFDADLKDPSPTRSVGLGHKNQTISVTDTKSALQGGISYQRREEFGFKRTRYSASFAKRLTKSSATGVTYRYSQDKYNSTKKNWHELSFGHTQIINKRLMLASIIQNPFHRTHDEAKITFGFQYIVTSMLYLMGDMSGQFFDEFSETLALKGSIQARILKDLYIRIGVSRDKQENLQSKTLGISWYPGRLALDLAYSTGEILDENQAPIFLISGEKIKEFSVGLTLRY